jgi:hypothetical protein
MHPDPTMQLAAIRQVELRQTATRHRGTAARRRRGTPWARRTTREQGA